MTLDDIQFEVWLPVVGTGEGDEWTATEELRENASSAEKRHEWTNYDLLGQEYREYHDALQSLVYEAIDAAELNECLTGDSYFVVAIGDLDSRLGGYAW
jgi:hypothetical protein